ncbi:MAG: FUSC family protein [Hansschlegelia sp.]
MFAFTPERFAPMEGIRAAFAMAVVLGLSVLLDNRQVAYGAVAAFWICLCDPLGSDRARFRTMASFTLLGVVVMPLASYCAHIGWGLAAPALFALVTACGLTRSYKPAYGPMPPQAGLIAAIAVIIGLSAPSDVRQALEMGGYFAVGAIWAAVLSLWIWPVSRRFTDRLMVVTLLGRLADMAKFLETPDGATRNKTQSDWLKFDTVYRRAVRTSIERAHESSAQSLEADPDLARSVNAASRTFSALIAIGRHLQRMSAAPDPSSRPLLGDFTALVRAFAEHIDRAEAATTLQRQAAALRRRTEGHGDLVARAVRFGSSAIETYADGSADRRSMDRVAPTAPVAERIKIDPLVWRHALRVASAVLIAYLVGLWFDTTLAYWGMIAALLVTQPLAGNTSLRVLERACGSLVGGCIAALLITLLPNPSAHIVGIVILAPLVIALRLVNYGLFVVVLTPMFMLLSDYIRPTEGLVLARAINEAVGAGVGIVASFLLWPEKEGDGLASSLSAAIAANMAFASAVLRDRSSAEELDEVQKQAGLASSRLEVARQRMLLNGLVGSIGSDRFWRVAVALREVCGSAAIREITSPTPSSEAEEARADRYDTLARMMVETADGRGGKAVLPVFEDTSDDLGEAVANLVAAVNRL